MSKWLGRGKRCLMRGTLEKMLPFPPPGKGDLRLGWSSWLGFVVDTRWWLLLPCSKRRHEPQQTRSWKTEGWASRRQQREARFPAGVNQGKLSRCSQLQNVSAGSGWQKFCQGAGCHGVTARGAEVQHTGGPVDQTRGREATFLLALAADSIFSFLDIPNFLTKAGEG